MKLYCVATLIAAGCALPGCGAAAARATTIDRQPPAAAAPATAPTGSAWFLFVDDLHLEFRNTGRLRDLLRTIARELIHEGDVFAARSSGPSSLSIDLTSDRTWLEAAIKKTTGNGLRPSDYLRTTQGPVDTREVRYRAGVALSTAQEMMLTLEQVHDRRKAFIYVSNGYDLDLSPDGRAATSGTGPPLGQGRDFSVARLQDQLWELTRTASRLNVTLFAIDPRVLVAAPAPDPTIDSVAWQNYWTTTQNSLRALSEPTGGFALDAADLIATLQRIRSAMRN